MFHPTTKILIASNGDRVEAVDLAANDYIFDPVTHRKVKVLKTELIQNIGTHVSQGKNGQSAIIPRSFGCKLGIHITQNVILHHDNNVLVRSEMKKVLDLVRLGWAYHTAAVATRYFVCIHFEEPARISANGLIVQPSKGVLEMQD